ncbi:MAG TPA: histidinol dehydrogenase, partial [Gammaproteobacteria bacterium]|nr:histidinol dehydrogenase [Gammaproteobacteria bacterium]
MIVADDVTATVSDILAQVRAKGDAAVLDYTNQFDGFGAQSMASLTVTREQMQASLESLDAAQREALEIAAGRIRSYHEKQKQESWQYREEDGSVLGQKVSPLQRVGVYAPGGKANYPSSILMLAIPAQVAGVEQIIATVPTAYGEAGKLVFAAAALAGVTELYTIGGAQAVAAMAYGTESIPKV